jgi:hypothetical protein
MCYLIGRVDISFKNILSDPQDPFTDTLRGSDVNTVIIMTMITLFNEVAYDRRSFRPEECSTMD